MRSNDVLGIAAFDLDGTLLRGRTVCEILAEPLGRSERMRYFESCNSQEEIAAARREMASWYRDHDLLELQRHLLNARWAPGAHEAVSRLRNAGVEVAILSITWGFAVRWFAEQVAVRCCLGTELLPDGEITHCWGPNKAEFLRQLMAIHSVTRDRVAAIGDSASDFPMIREAGLRIFVGTAQPEIPDVLHLPNVNIQTIADKILETWA
jgi:phosphoserine phosphatase